MLPLRDTVLKACDTIKVENCADRMVLHQRSALG